jgi:HSP90 family molecular chaperone
MKRACSSIHSCVLIRKNAADLLPDYFSFEEGLCGQRGPDPNISANAEQDIQHKHIKTPLVRNIKNERPLA